MDLDPNHFINMATVTDLNTARTIATAFVRHRPETTYPGIYRSPWNELPQLLADALINVFDLFGALYLVDPDIMAELHRVAARAASRQGSLSQWTMSNNTYFWNTTLTQVSDIFLAAGRAYTTPSAISVALASIPDFVEDPAAAAHLEMITQSAYEQSFLISAPSTVARTAEPTHSTQWDCQPDPALRAQWDRRQDGDRTRPRSRPTQSPANPAPGRSENPCADWNSTTRCMLGDDCHYRHSLPTTGIMATRILAIITSRGFVPSRALTAFSEANPPSCVASPRRNNKKTRPDDGQQVEVWDSESIVESDESDSDYSEESRR